MNLNYYWFPREPLNIFLNRTIFDIFNIKFDHSKILIKKLPEKTCCFCYEPTIKNYKVCKNHFEVLNKKNNQYGYIVRFLRSDYSLICKVRYEYKVPIFHIIKTIQEITEKNGIISSSYNICFIEIKFDKLQTYNLRE